jgi:succinate dehydrogenase / fumarate reductase, iron-sulfur subunit
MSKRTLHIWRGDTAGGALVAYEIEAETGMVVLDAVLEIQRSQANDLAVRWNCKAAKCGSCSAEINGRPRLMCKTRLDHLPEDEPLTVEPLRTFPAIRDLVTDVSWNYEVNKRIPLFTPKPDTEWAIPSRRMSTGSPSSGSASSASSARTCATSCAITSCSRATSGRAS